MKKTLPRLFSGLLLSGALLVPTMLTPTLLRADDRRYHDNRHNDDHVWNDHEDRAYRIWVRDHHRKYVEFSRLRPADQQTYWGWRHEHSDALLKIEIR